MDEDKIALTPSGRALMAPLTNVDLKNFQAIAQTINRSFPEELREEMSWDAMSLMVIMEKLHREV